MTTPLTGWGRTAPTRATVARPRTAEEAAELVAKAGRRGVVARGLGRAYGDAAQNAGGLVLDCTALDCTALDCTGLDCTGLDGTGLDGTGLDCTGLERSWHVDSIGLVTASAGASLHDLMTALVPRGWFVPVTPGTRYVTIGGAVAADVHGKNHHVDSSFGAHLRSLRLLTADGSVRTLGPGDDLFWATVGGMGLTGIVVEATFQCVPIETAWMRVDVERTRDLDQTLETMAATDDGHRYTVAWIDLLARGGRMGRGVLTRGDHAAPGDLPARARGNPLAFAPRPLLSAPPWAPGGLLNRATVRAFNAAWYGKAPAAPRRIVQGVAPFFHPLDGVAGWNRMYGPRGFVQYQFVVPLGAEDTLRRVVERLSGAGVVSFLTVLKRFGAGTPGMLSFPMPGWTLALDIPAGQSGLAAMLTEFDGWVAAAGGRLYLAKDSRMSAATMAATYPRLGEWQEIRRRADPDGVFVSDLARRLRLC